MSSTTLPSMADVKASGISIYSGDSLPCRGISEITLEHACRIMHVLNIGAAGEIAGDGANALFLSWANLQALARTPDTLDGCTSDRCFVDEDGWVRWTPDPNFNDYPERFIRTDGEIIQWDSGSDRRSHFISTLLERGPMYHQPLWASATIPAPWPATKAGAQW